MRDRSSRLQDDPGLCGISESGSRNIEQGVHEACGTGIRYQSFQRLEDNQTLSLCSVSSRLTTNRGYTSGGVCSSRTGDSDVVPLLRGFGTFESVYVSITCEIADGSIEAKHLLHWSLNRQPVDTIRSGHNRIDTPCSKASILTVCDDQLEKF